MTFFFDLHDLYTHSLKTELYDGLLNVRCLLLPHKDNPIAVSYDTCSRRWILPWARERKHS